MLVNLLAIGAACALGAFLISLRLRDRGRIQRSGLLFVVMLALMLAALYPQLYGVFGAIGIVAALAYAVLALRQMREEHENGDDSSDS